MGGWGTRQLITIATTFRPFLSYSGSSGGLDAPVYYVFIDSSILLSGPSCLMCDWLVHWLRSISDEHPSYAHICRGSTTKHQTIDTHSIHLVV